MTLYYVEKVVSPDGVSELGDGFTINYPEDCMLRRRGDNVTALGGVSVKLASPDSYTGVTVSTFTSHAAVEAAVLGRLSQVANDGPGVYVY